MNLITFFSRLCLGVLFASCALSGGEVRVAAAANMSFVLPDIVKRFHASYPETIIRIQYGGSGKLRAQIENGAPYDLFLSANTAYVEALYEKGLTIDKPKVYAKGALALLSVKGTLLSANLSSLKEKTYEKIAVANPKTAPYGAAAVEALQRAGVYRDIKEKLIFAESVSQTVIYTLKAADVGIIAKSALYAPRLLPYKEGRHWVEVSKSLYTPISQAMALLLRAKDNQEAKRFYGFLQSEEAKAILKRYGYEAP